jgi:hypothetical protein
MRTAPGACDVDSDEANLLDLVPIGFVQENPAENEGF